MILRRPTTAALVSWFWCACASANPPESAMDTARALEYAALQPSELAAILRPTNTMESAHRRSQEAIERSQRLKVLLDQAVKNYLNTAKKNQLQVTYGLEKINP